MFAFLFAMTSATVEQVAGKCGLLIQMPSALDTYLMLKRTLDVNCFNYYNVGVPRNITELVEVDYNAVIARVEDYQAKYARNEHVLFNIKAWMSMDASDPLTAMQRSLKECNAQLLVNFFGHEDIRASLPTFISSLEYMRACFEDTKHEAEEQRARLFASYLEKEAAAKGASEAVRQAFAELTTAQQKLVQTRGIFERYIRESQISVGSLFT